MALLGLSALPVVRRRAFEAFAYTHRVAAAVAICGAALHWNGFLWYTLPGALLYLSDHASQLVAAQFQVHPQPLTRTLARTLAQP